MSGKKTGTWRTVVAGSVLAATATLALAAGGSLDPTFGTGGVVTIETGATGATNGSSLTGLAVQGDGKTLECGYADTGRKNEAGLPIFEWQTRRLQANGSLDTGFGSGGLVRLFGDNSGSSKELAIDASGRVLVVGDSKIKTVLVSGTGKKAKTTYSWTQYATLVRLTAAGGLDTSFGSAGVVRTAVPGAANAVGEDLVVQPDGRIVITGTASFADSTKLGGYRQEPFIARYLGNGALDTSLGGDGITVDTRPLPGFTNFAFARGVALQSTGKILVAATRSPNNWTVSRFTADGVLDTAFASIATPDLVRSVSVDRLDRIVATGSTPNVNSSFDIRLARYGADGAADASFGTSGVVTLNAYPRESANTRALFQPADDKIVFGASVSADPSQGMPIRLTDSGALDTTFGSGGWGTSVHGVTEAALAPGGEIVVGGTVFASPFTTLFLARYAAN